MKALTPAIATSREDYFKLKACVMNNGPAALEYLSAMLTIKESKSYLHEAATWEEWCGKFAGRSSEAIRKLLFRERQRQARRLIVETTAEPPPPKPQEEKPLPAKQDSSSPVEYSKPPPVPVPAPPPAPHTAMLPASAIESARLLAKDLESLMKDTGFAASDRFRHCVRLANHIVACFAPVLPGLEEHVSTKAKGSKTDVIRYAVIIGLPETDGEWFFDKNQGCGWKINGRAMEDWRGCMRAWKLQSIFPSQKGSNLTNGRFNNKPGPANRNAGTLNQPDQYGSLSGNWNTSAG